MRTLSVFCLLSLAALGAEPLKFPATSPTLPGEAEKTFEMLHGFRMELLAAEPLVTDPVALCYDEDGRAYVAEMNDYPYTDKARHTASQENPTDAPIGKIRLLTDDDGDGKFDRSTTFADGLSWPTGVACWKGGVIVTATPDVWYLKDTDGDGKADVREKLLTGFKKLNVQAVLNNPVWGLDNRLYLAGGSNGGEIARPGGKPVAMRRADVRLDPRDGSFELVSGGARFGNTRDDWGNRFLCNIRNPAQHVVIESRYLARQPYLPAMSPLVDVTEAGDQLPVHRVSPPEAWRELRARRWSADSTVTARTPRSELVGTGVVTSSSGVTVYRGDAYPAEFRGNIFVADVAGNLFYRLVTQPDGVTFRAKRVDGDREFCAGRDVWFRPVNFANAPDGCLHVCDMYREVIEHPWSLPDDIHAALDLERGRDKGRLYRLAPPDFKPRATLKLSKASTAELVALLAHPNAWHRDTAHRLLFERQAKSAVPALREMMTKHAKAFARLHALWTLEGLGALKPDDALAAMHDADEHVRTAGVLLVEPRLNSSEPLRAAVMGLSNDTSAFVRFQVALSLGEAMDESAISVMAAITGRDPTDPWMRAAVLSSTGAQMAKVAALLMKSPDSTGGAAFLRDAGTIVGAAAKSADCTLLLDALGEAARSHPAMSEAGVLGLAKGLARHGKTPRDFATSGVTTSWLGSLEDKATAGALNSSARLNDRAHYIALLTLEDFPTLKFVAARVLAPREPDGVRIAFVRLLQERREAGVAALLLDAWPTLTPAVREAAASALASRKEWLAALFDAMETQRVKSAELSPAVRASLQRFPDIALRERAAKLFTASGSRTEVLARYEAVLTRKGDATKGAAIYAAACATCHRKGDTGIDLGPNLATVAAWPAEQMLTNILDPNREVSPNFMLYTVELKDGRALAGVITAETETGLTLKRLDGVDETVSRADVATLRATGTSAMPEGLEAAISVEQMADLIAFLRDAP
ncbi:MAG: PVC-type heme-binding CxxCH protein [Chthoniobacteraceae bacterium]